MNKANMFVSAYMAISGHVSLSMSDSLSADKHSCFTPPEKCISATAEWSPYAKDRLIVTYTNQCDYRIYLKKCNVLKNGADDCSSSGLKAGQTTKWSTSGAINKYHFKVIGVLDQRYDNVCADKQSNW